MTKNKLFFLLVGLILGLTFIQPVLAEKVPITQQMQTAVGLFDLPSTDKPELLAGQVIQALLSIFGIIFFALMLYGGYKWMIAQGREEEIKKAKETIRAAIIGLVVVFAAFAISVFVISRISQATNWQQPAATTDTTTTP